MTKQFNLYAMGSALVDTEVKVNPQFLAEQGIEKGVMTLVEEARQLALIAQLEKHNSHIDRACGGSACNSAVAASYFGAKVAFSGRVCADKDGELFAHDLAKAGIDFHDKRATDGVTGKCLVMVTPDADRTMNTYLGASMAHNEDDIDWEKLAASEWLYLEGYLLTDEPRTDMVVKAVQFARQNGVKVALSLSDPFVVAVFESALHKVIGDGVDLIFCNADEAKAFTKESSLDKAAFALRKYCHAFAITDGGHGALVGDNKSLSRVEGFEANAIDTNGAGDMFAGAFLAVLIRGGNQQQAASFANRCAAKVVAKYGPRLSKASHETLMQYFPR